jgi:hypothetical protein
VHITLPSGVTRTAIYLSDQGCVTLPVGKTSVDFKPVKIKSSLPDPATQLWPMGDALPKEPLPPELDAAKLKQAVDAAFEPAGAMTAVVVTWRGRLIAERYGEGITVHTPLEGWSMGKSLSATLMGILFGLHWRGVGEHKAAVVALVGELDAEAPALDALQESRFVILERAAHP